MEPAKRRLEANGREVRLKPARTALEEARKLVRAHVERGEMLVDELIEERKREARREFRRA